MVSFTFLFYPTTDRIINGIVAYCDEFHGFACLKILFLNPYRQGLILREVRNG